MPVSIRGVRVAGVVGVAAAAAVAAGLFSGKLTPAGELQAVSVRRAVIKTLLSSLLL
jgi:hypothetical protein